MGWGQPEEYKGGGGGGGGGGGWRGCGEASIQPAGCPWDKKQTALNGRGTLPVPDVHHPGATCREGGGVIGTSTCE